MQISNGMLTYKSGLQNRTNGTACQEMEFVGERQWNPKARSCKYNGTLKYEAVHRLEFAGEMSWTCELQT